MQTVQLPIVSRNSSLKPSQTPWRSLKIHIRGVKQGRTYRSHLLTAQREYVWIKATRGLFGWCSILEMFHPQRKSLYFVITEVISTNDTDRFILLNGKLHLLMLEHVTLLNPGSSQRYANLLWQWQRVQQSSLYDSVSTAKVQIMLSWVTLNLLHKAQLNRFNGRRL